MPNTEQSIQETGGIPEIEVSLEVSGMTMTPVDKTLTVDSMAADAKATGDAIADVKDAILDINSDISGIMAWSGVDIPITGATDSESIASAMSAANNAINTIMAWTGEDVPINGITGASSIAEAMNDAKNDIRTIQAWTGMDIPINGDTGANSIAEAIEQAGSSIEQIMAWTGTDIPITGDTGAGSIAGEVAGLKTSVLEVSERTGAEILYGITGETGSDETIKQHVDALENGIVRSVNNVQPNSSGNVGIDTVDFAKNLKASENATQQSVGTYLQRSTGGSASISDGNAILTKVSGNSIHTGYIAENKEIEYVAVDTESDAKAEINWVTFKEYVTENAELEFVYSSAWKLNGESVTLSNYGITITGTAENGDQINVSYTKEVRGTITNAMPRAFVSTGWNLFSYSLGYAKVVKYADTANYRADGTYTQLQFSATLNGTRTTITPNVTTHIFTIPSDGYVWVTGGDTTSTAIYPTWSDWTNGYAGNFMSYYKTEISLSDIMDTYFAFGLCSIQGIADEIDIENSTYTVRIARIEYSAENLTTVIGYGVPYEYDENYIYYVNSSATAQSYTLNGNFVAYDHGIEYFVADTSTPVIANTSYFPDLKNRVERDVLTISQQTLSNDQKATVRANVGVAAASDVSEINNKLNGLFKKVYYTYTISSLAANTNLTITAANFGMSTPSGYKPLSIYRFTSGSVNFHVAYINIDTTGSVMGIRNVLSSAQTDKTIGIGILYVKTGLGI